MIDGLTITYSSLISTTSFADLAFFSFSVKGSCVQSKHSSSFSSIVLIKLLHYILLTKKTKF